MIDDGLRIGPDGRARCWWPGTDPDYVAYHDREWGHPITDDRRLFEKLSLEAFQSGLSWLTILRKRDNFRKAFAGFDPERVARFGRSDVSRLLGDAGIVRHRGKIEATIHNAGRALELIAAEGSLAAYVWGFAPATGERPARLSYEAVRALAHTPASRALSGDLRRRGWKFVGPTTVYAFMQAAGLVNDHLDGCAFRAAVEEARLRNVGLDPSARGPVGP
ncbi:MAG TPA: DNA-3-methyladenine glycosylase I [Longimicrobiales bacterium]|nr:DNA-3-methyladenine glycosylase I [Longimicrobiales bacterium]